MKIITFLFTAALLQTLIYAQTFQWVSTVPLDIQTNPAFLHCPTVLDNNGSLVSARLINSKEIYSIAYYGDFLIEKTDSSGLLIWADSINGKADVAEIIADGENNIIGYGTFIDTLVIGNSALIRTGQGTGSFIFKSDSDGNLIWLKDGAQYITGFGVITALEPDSLNNILIGTSDYPVESKILKLDAEGNQTSIITETNIATISDIKKDPAGNIWATGFAFNGPVSFNGHDTTAPFSYTEYVVKYNPAGIAERINFIQDVTVQQFQIETDDSGNAYLAGNLLDSTSFGELHANGPQWIYDFFVTKIDPDGNFIWLNEIPQGNPLGDAFVGNDNFLSCDADGNTYLTGTFRGTINFGDSLVLTPLNYDDIFAVSYDRNGVIEWAKAAGSDLYDVGCSITPGEPGNYYLSGLTGQNFVFDTISGTGEIYNLYLAKLKSESTVITGNENTGERTRPYKFTLMQNYPNPFNPSTKIKYSVAASEFISLKVYDILGKEITVLVNEYKPAGNYEVNFYASKLSGGVYFYRLQSGTAVLAKKMIVLK